MVLSLAISYGGRAEIADAARQLARDVERGTVDPDRLRAAPAMVLFGACTAAMIVVIASRRSAPGSLRSSVHLRTSSAKSKLVRGFGSYFAGCGNNPGSPAQPLPRPRWRWPAARVGWG